MVEQQEYDRIWRATSDYQNAHPGVMVSFDNGPKRITVHEADGTTCVTYRKVFWISIGFEPYPYRLVATRKQTEDYSPQAAWDKALALAAPYVAAFEAARQTANQAAYAEMYPPYVEICPRCGALMGVAFELMLQQYGILWETTSNRKHWIWFCKTCQKSGMLNELLEL